MPLIAAKTYISAALETLRMGAGITVVAGIAALAAPLALAQSSEDGADPTGALEEVRERLEQSDERREDLERAATELAEETEALSGKLIATAGKIQAREAQITAGEERLEKLSFEETIISGELQQRHEALSELLAGLQRLETDPPPPIAVKPEDALSAMRGAMLLKSVVPELRGQANALAQSLARIADLRTAITTEQTEIADNLAALDEERRQITNLLQQKEELTASISQELVTERQNAETLAERAQSLQDLLARLEQARRESELARAEAEQNRQDELAREREERLARLSQPSVAFSKARGQLNYPAQGTRIRDYGSDDELGSSSEGVYIETRNFAQITTSNDGWVVYAGEFRGYGQLLIINAGEGYHVLLAGLEQITVNVGQFIRAGEPVGTMGATAAHSTIIGSRSLDGKPVLYVEFRKNGNAIDPRPWWAGNDERVRG